MELKLSPAQEYARHLVGWLLLSRTTRDLETELGPKAPTFANIKNGKRGAGRDVLEVLVRHFPEHRDGLNGLTPWVDPARPVASTPQARPPVPDGEHSPAVEYPDRYPNRVEAMRAFATVYRCSEEEVQRISQVAAVALHSETDPSVEAWFKELERARAYLKRERRGHGHLGEREVDPEDA